MVSLQGREGDKVRIGEDPWMGCAGNYKLFESLKSELANTEIQSLANAAVEKASSIWNQVWKTKS